MLYKVLIAYDGYDYHGWQYQPNERTVVGELRKSFTKVFFRDVSIIGASRTDAGVHALGQVALVSTDFSCSPERLKAAWQGGLPPDIILRSIAQVSSDFHPQRHVAYKIYEYYISHHRLLPHAARYVTWYRHAFDAQRLENALQVFVGKHDFRSYCTGDERECTVRTIESITVRYNKRLRVYVVRFKGPGFLRYMIRRIIGAALQKVSEDLVNATNHASAALFDVLMQKNPEQQLWTAAPRGLVLRRIVYDS